MRAWIDPPAILNRFLTPTTSSLRIFFKVNGSTEQSLLPLAVRCYWGSMTWEEIRCTYPNQWVIIDVERLDDALEVVAGRVIAAAPTREEIYRRVMTDASGRDVAIRYCGDLPADFAVMFWLQRSV
jgi:hypothetical protein